MPWSASGRNGVGTSGRPGPAQRVPERAQAASLSLSLPVPQVREAGCSLDEAPGCGGGQAHFTGRSKRHRPKPAPPEASHLLPSGPAGEAGTGPPSPPHRAPDPASAGRGSPREQRPLPTPPLWVGFPSEHTVSLAAPKSALQAAAKPDHLPIPLRQINEHEPAKEPFSVYQGLGHTNLQTKRGGKAPADREGGGWRPPSAHLSSIPGTAPLNERGCLGLRPRSLDLLCSVNLGCS